MFVTRYTKQFLIITALIFAVSIGIISTLGVPFGIDFTGGALTEVSYDERPSKEELQVELDTLSLGGYSLRSTTEETGREGYILRTRELSEEERARAGAILTAAGEGGTIGRFTSIGPVIGEELADKAKWALGGVLLIIVLYVAFVFRKVSKPINSWTYGGITIFVLFHDVLVPAALMSILGYYSGAEADVLFVMALLAVLGYSVNDTIVVFDRVRENLVKYRQEKKEKVQGGERITYIFTKPFDEIVGISVSQTLVRSINTSLTTLVALSALYIFGGSVTETFALMLIAGVIAGTYSSICIANPLLIAIARWQAKKQNK